MVCCKDCPLGGEAVDGLLQRLHTGWGGRGWSVEKSAQRIGRQDMVCCKDCRLSVEAGYGLLQRLQTKWGGRIWYVAKTAD